MNIVSLVHRRMRWRHLCLFLFFPFVLLLVDYSSAVASNHTACPAVTGLRGEGSTFDAPLFNQLFSVYAGMPCGFTVDYYATGSGAGISQLLNQLTDFAATDAPLTKQQLASSPGGTIVHIPVTLGAVAISYHLTGVSSPLHLSGAALADIYQGHIKSWDDPAIVRLNAGVALPNRPIQVLHRSDGSGTTAIFTHYLSDVSPQWQSKVGAGTTVNWPVGSGAQGNGGVADQLSRTEGSIGYVELSYVTQFHLAVASIENKAGTYVPPSIVGAQAAAAGVETVPADLRFYAVNASGTQAYPITGYSWVIVYRHQMDMEKGKALAQLLWWIIHDGQMYAEPAGYAPLPKSIVVKGEGQIHSMTCGARATTCFTK
jgi:phosphate transport system substrate-binding protein